jgi:hypothetical protein
MEHHGSTEMINTADLSNFQPNHSVLSCLRRNSENSSMHFKNTIGFFFMPNELTYLPDAYFTKVEHNHQLECVANAHNSNEILQEMPKMTVVNK